MVAEVNKEDTDRGGIKGVRADIPNQDATVRGEDTINEGKAMEIEKEVIVPEETMMTNKGKERIDPGGIEMIAGVREIVATDPGEIRILIVMDLLPIAFPGIAKTIQKTKDPEGQEVI